MAQNWLGYLGILTGLLIIAGLAVFLKQRDALVNKQLREIRNSQAELLRKVSGRELDPERERDAPRFRPPSQDPSGLSRAETELLTKVRAVRGGGDSSGDDAG